MSVHNRLCLSLSDSWLLKALSLITSYNNREIRCCNPSISYVYRNIYISTPLSNFQEKLTLHLPSVCMSICLSAFLCIFYLSICLSVYRSICLSIYLFIYLSICLSNSRKSRRDPDPWRRWPGGPDDREAECPESIFPGKT